MNTISSCRAAAIALLLAAGAQGASAADRPYLVTNSAAAEEDEEQVWAVENWYAREGGRRSVTVAPEYAFDPVNSLQVEFRRVLDRDEASGHEIELEFKHLFTRIARDGYGFGAVLTLDTERRSGAGPFERSATSLFLPLTLPVGEALGQLHVNAGIAWPRDQRRRAIGSLAGDVEVWRRTQLFGEWARDSEGALAQAGVRHWIRRERLAVDLAWQRVRGEGVTGSGVVLGIAWYDL